MSERRLWESRETARDEGSGFSSGRAGRNEVALCRTDILLYNSRFCNGAIEMLTHAAQFSA